MFPTASGKHPESAMLTKIFAGILASTLTAAPAA